MKLEGIRVVDLSLFLPGPLMTQFMADHGAEVVKVESIREGEPNREIGPKRDGVSVYFANTHRGKQSLALNLKDPAGVEVLLRLAEKSDVLVEAFRPGVAERLGIGYAQVAARAPHIVYASIAAFGQRVQSEEHRGRVVIHHQSPLRAHQFRKKLVGVRVALSAPSFSKIVFQVRISPGYFLGVLHRLASQRRAAQLGV